MKKKFYLLESEDWSYIGDHKSFDKAKKCFYKWCYGDIINVKVLDKYPLAFVYWESCPKKPPKHKLEDLK